MVKLKIDGKFVEVQEGKRLLDACLENGIYIPNLCYLEEMEKPSASCRLCFVEIEGEEKPASACRVIVEEGMAVRTDTEKVREMQRSVFELLLSTHQMNCKSCPSKKKCQLAKIARLLGVPLRPGKVVPINRDLPAEQEHPFWQLVPSRCVLCGKCIFVCKSKHEHSYLTMAGRGSDLIVEAMEIDPDKLPCDSCRACAEVCPVSAIVCKEDIFEQRLAS